jgi:ankyrin repeat protein
MYMVTILHMKTPLYCATINNRLDATILLLDSGANMSHIKMMGNIVEIASRRGYINIVKILIERGLDKINSVSRYHSIRLAILARNIPMVKLLVGTFGDIVIINGPPRNQTYHTWDVVSIIRNACSKGDIDLIRGLIDAGMKFNYFRDDLISHVRKMGKYKLVQLLTEV